MFKTYEYTEQETRYLTILRDLGFEANVVGGQLRVAMHGGITNDTDIAVLCDWEDIAHVQYALSCPPEHKNSWYNRNTGYLADFRVDGDVNVILYDRAIFDSIRTLVKSFDISINQYYLNAGMQIMHDDFDGVNVYMTPYYNTDRSVGSPPKPERILRFCTEYPELNWAYITGVHLPPEVPPDARHYQSGKRPVAPYIKEELDATFFPI